MNIFACFLFLLLPFTTISHEDRFVRTFSPNLRTVRHQEYLEVSYPPLSTGPTPSCSRKVLHHSFANTINSPPYTTHYSPPSHCPSPWSRVLLHFHASSRGDQYDRIAAIWLGGAELLRTSTAEPTPSGIFWNVRKDVTRYSSLLARSDLTLSVMLENVVNSEFTGVYHVTVTLLYYNENAVRVPFRPGGEGFEPDRRSRSLITNRESENIVDLNESPADLIIPISDNGKRGFWFTVESEKDVHSRKVRIPRNSHRAVLELCVSFHGNDEFWYTNPPTSYITANGLTTGRGNGPYREVYVTIDGETVGWEVPFPVIFTGGINPLFWEPVVAIGAFDLPSYDMDLTPFLGKLLDGKEHTFGIGVAQGISYWLVNANLHLWLDHESKVVHANPVVQPCPETSLERQEEFQGLDGEFEVDAQRETQVAGWVTSSAGNVTTVIEQGFQLKNFMKFQHNGTYKEVKQKFRAKKKVKVTSDRGKTILKLKVKREYPLRVITWNQPSCCDDDMYRLVTNVSHAFEERHIGMCFWKTISNVQDSKGWMEVKGHNVLSGQASTRQDYKYIDKFNCYTRNVAAANGRLIIDDSNFKCENSF